MNSEEEVFLGGFHHSCNRVYTFIPALLILGRALPCLALEDLFLLLNNKSGEDFIRRKWNSACFGGFFVKKVFMFA